MRPGLEVHDNIKLKRFPICLAYALTIHKVQGLTLNKLIVGGVDRFWQPQLLYVALSRVRSEDHIKFLPSMINESQYYSYQQMCDLFEYQGRNI